MTQSQTKKPTDTSSCREFTSPPYHDAETTLEITSSYWARCATITNRPVTVVRDGGTIAEKVDRFSVFPLAGNVRSEGIPGPPYNSPPQDANGRRREAIHSDPSASTSQTIGGPEGNPPTSIKVNKLLPKRSSKVRSKDIRRWLRGVRAAHAINSQQVEDDSEEKYFSASSTLEGEGGP